MFSAGADVTELREMTTRDIIDYYDGSGSVYEGFAGLPQPTVAGDHGLLPGRRSGTRARRRHPNRGSRSYFRISRSIGRVVGAGRARDLVLRGRRFDAREAERWGIISEIVCAGEHVKRGIEIAHELAGHSPATLRVTKQVLDASVDSPKATALLLEQLAYAVLNDTSL